MLELTKCLPLISEKTEGKLNASAGDTKINNREEEKDFTSFYLKLGLLVWAAAYPGPLRKKVANDYELIAYQVGCWMLHVLEEKAWETKEGKAN